MDLKLRGNSNYKLKVVNENNPMVVKYSYEYDERLLKSAWKQGIFKSNYFKTPKINFISEDINQSSFEMKFIPGNSFVEFFSSATKNDLDLLIEKLKGYFKETIKEEKRYPLNIFFNKIHEIGYRDYEFIFNGVVPIKMYVGECHGDMTFSNMIFSKDIYLIDFLDSYVESPTMDLIKLRQDTHLHYSLNMVKTSEVDKTKIKMCLNYIDEWIVSTYDIESYRPLQIVNLLRILPYTKNENVKKFIELKIKELCQH